MALDFAKQLSTFDLVLNLEFGLPTGPHGSTTEAIADIIILKQPQQYHDLDHSPTGKSSAKRLFCSVNADQHHDSKQSASWTACLTCQIAGFLVCSVCDMVVKIRNQCHPIDPRLVWSQQ